MCMKLVKNFNDPSNSPNYILFTKKQKIQKSIQLITNQCNFNLDTITHVTTSVQKKKDNFYKYRRYTLTPKGPRRQMCHFTTFGHAIVALFFIMIF
jgi:hypothetical protein